MSKSLPFAGCVAPAPRSAQFAALIAALLSAACSHPVASVVPSPTLSYSFGTHVTGIGTPMILIPSLMSSGRVWDSVVAHYNPHYQVHVLDLPGYAGRPAAGDSAVLEHIASDLGRYIREQRLTKPILIGHSLGGLLAFRVAAEAPDIIGRVISVDGLPYAPAVQDPRASAMMMRPTATTVRMSYRQLTGAQLETQARAISNSMTLSSAFADTLAAWSRRSDPATVGDVIADMLTTDLRPSVSRIRAPVLLVGTFGLAVDSAGRARTSAAYEQQIAGITRHSLVMAEHSRHFVMVDALPWLLTTIDAFLAASGNESLRPE